MTNAGFLVLYIWILLKKTQKNVMLQIAPKIWRKNYALKPARKIDRVKSPIVQNRRAQNFALRHVLHVQKKIWVRMIEQTLNKLQVKQEIFVVN